MEKAFALCYRFLSFRPRTVFEVEQYLQKKAQKYIITPNEIQSVIETLKDQGFLNDIEFIKSFITSRNILKPKSRKVLEMELRQHGVSESDIDIYFQENISNEDELALRALQGKLKLLHGLTDDKKRFIKGISFLQRRGFTYDVAKKAYLQLIHK